MKEFITLLLLVTSCISNSQNLVRNSSFENVTNEPITGCEFQFMQDWINPSHGICGNYNNGTPDIFSYYSVGGARLPNTFMGSLTPHTGDRVVGIVTYVHDINDYREYFTSQLVSPLVVGKQYSVKLWIRNANPPTYIYHSNSIQIAFSLDSLTQTMDDIIPNVTPQLSIDSVIRDTTWTLHQYIYTPDQPYRYMTIGNYRSDANTILELFGVNNGTNRPYAYYFFDDISVTTTTIQAFSDTTLCSDASVQLRAENSSNGSYYWYDVNTPGTYIDNDSLLLINNVTSNMQYVATDGIDNDTVTITIIPTNFTINLGADTTVCGDINLTLSANQPATWSTGVTASSITVSTPGTYWAAIANSCVSTSDTINISQRQKPIIDLGPDQNICTGDSVLLTTATAVSNYLWNTGASTASLYANQPGIYTLQVWNNAACIATDTVQVLSSDVSGLSLGNDTTVCGGEIILKVPVSGATYVWQDNSVDSIYYVVSSGTYAVTVTSACGTASDEVRINNYADECALNIPTAFTPNNDGINDRFGPIARCPMEKMHMRVYNRWGELVFETQDIMGRWNGMYKGTNQPIGTYVFLVEYFNFCQQKLVQESGNFTLLR